MRINTNIAALNTQRRLVTNSDNMQGSLAKLSSGLRINSAADDAAANADDAANGAGCKRIPGSVPAICQHAESTASDRKYRFIIRCSVGSYRGTRKNK